jgi:cytochrome P450
MTLDSSQKYSYSHSSYTIVSIWPWPMFHNPKFFNDAESFVPERWLGDPKYEDDRRVAVQLLPVGPRNCIGKK